MDSYLENEPS